VLVAESNRGRCFEVTPAGEIVWEFLNPELSLARFKRGTIYRMERYAPGYFRGGPLAALEPAELRLAAKGPRGRAAP
jgi:hypothetical protein